MKQTVSEQALALVEKKLPALKGSLTPQDAATATGITVGEAKDALTRLMELYITRVSYDEQGNILFAFEYPLRRRGTKTAAEKWAETKDALWRGFKVFFKIWIGLMVIVYFAVMAILLIALIVAQKAATRDDSDDDSGAGHMLGGLFRVLAEGLQFAFYTRAMTGGYDYDYGIDSYGYRHRQVRTPRSIDKGKKSFIISIYDLALGPERPSADPLENEKEVATFLRAENGILTPAEIVALSGGDVTVAEERMADYLVRFNGEPTITDEGVVVGEFESFVSGKTAQAEGRIVAYWDEFEAPYEHSGNSTGRNVIILGMVAFTLVVGLGLLGGGLDALTVYGSFFGTGLARFILGYIPVLFSLIYMGIAALRFVGVRKREQERLERNRKKKVMRVLFQSHMWRATAGQVYFAMLSVGDKELSQEQVATILQALVIELQGDIELSEDGEPIYVFERMHRELEAAERIRKRPARL